MVETKNNKNKKRISPTGTAAIGALIILIGGFFLSYNYIQSMKIYAYDNMADAIYTEDDNGEAKIVVPEEKKEEEKGSNEQTETTNYEQERYVGYLSIPKIGFRKGFFAKESGQNDVEKNIYIVKGSAYPDVERGNFIIAAHSGTGWKAFFNDLYKLEKNDSVEVEYNGKKYIYNIKKIYKQEKTGTIAIYRDYSKTTLTLVTCTNYDSKTQTIYIAELASVE